MSDIEDPKPPMSYNDAMRAIGGKTVGDITPEEAEAVVCQMMRSYLNVPEGESFSFTEDQFAAAINAMPMEEYATKRAAIAAYRLP
jgi:hypothetical protein